MIDKNLDYALIGHNYITYLLAISLLKRNKSVLLLDDDRFNYGDFFTNSLTRVELDFLIAIGNGSQLDLLTGLEKYCSMESRFFYFGKTQVKLGGLPSENLLELLRKFPHLFKSEIINSINPDFLKEFDREYFEYCQNVGNKIFSNDKHIKFFQIFNDLLGPNLKLFLNSFIDSVIDRSIEKQKTIDYINDDLSLFIYLTRGFYHSHFSTGGSKIELFHVLLCLLSPYYRMDHILLTNDLLKSFKDAGGDFKKLNLADIKFNRGSVKGILLESFEGHISPKKLIFVGGHPIGLPIKFERPKNIFNCLSATILVESIPTHLIGKKIVFSSSLKMGTNQPMFEADFFVDKIELNIVIAKRNGIKVSFIKEQMSKDLLNDFEYLFADLKLKILDIEMNFTHDIFIEESFKKYRLKDDFKVKNKLHDMIFNVGPLIFNRPKNVHYLGPYNDGFLGTLSSLVEIRKWQDRL